ncbi:MAG: hypothetical protein RR938_07725 [Muribaculaceae bacterium]
MKKSKHDSLYNEIDNDTINVLNAAYSTWINASQLRAVRQRNKNFTYGNQWGDLVKSKDGRRIPESQLIEESGKEPLANNLIRQLVKSVVGRFRTTVMAKRDKTSNYMIDSDTKPQTSETEPMPDLLAKAYEDNILDELDSRGLEEFLISGCCVQKVSLKRRLNKNGIRVDNININHFFTNAIKDARAWDCEIIGELHDMSISELIMRLADGNRDRAAWLRSIYSTNIGNRIINTQSIIGANNEKGADFWHTNSGKCRVIEVWTLESREIIKCHDYAYGTYYIADNATLPEIEAQNAMRSKTNTPVIDTQWDIEEMWHCRWISPMGDLLKEYDSPYNHHSHPYALKMYPLTDGEIHSFVEDIIDQQKYINRLITLVDHIMGASAKGVLLFPTDALPDGFTWEDIKRTWSSSNGIIPFEAGRSLLPQQISTNATNIGAYELLSLQMKLFEEISGVSGALQGKTAGNGTGAQLYDRQTENSAIALADIFETFNSFRKLRDNLITNI